MDGTDRQVDSEPGYSSSVSKKGREGREGVGGDGEDV